MINTKNGVISNIVVSTIAGHSGKGIFPLSLLPEYRQVMRIIKKTKTTVLTKSATRFKRVGNCIPWNPFTWKYIQNLPNNSLLNAYGLTNDGVEKCAHGIFSSHPPEDRIIPNFYPEFAKGTETAIAETIQAGEIYYRIAGPYFWIIELNFSCPNSKEKIEENIGQGAQCVKELKRKFPWLVIIAKLSIVHPYELAEELELINPNLIIHAVNTVPYGMIYNDISPLWVAGGGGVSGPESFPKAFAYNKKLRNKTKLRIIMGNGAGSLSAVRKYWDIGADSVSICTVVRRNAKEAIKILEIYNEEKGKGGYDGRRIHYYAPA